MTPPRIHDIRLSEATFTAPPPRTACTVCGESKPGDLELKLGGHVCEACGRAQDAADPVAALGLHTPFRATLEGVQYRFYAAEHFNIGPGWMCFEIDGRLPRGVYASSAFSDVAAIAPTADMPGFLRQPRRPGVYSMITIETSSPPQEVDPGRMNFTFAVPEFALAPPEPDDDLADLADPNAGQLVEADDGRTQRVGAFYWVQPVLDTDTAAGMDWMDEEQPARFAGRNAKGELLWHVLALEGDEAHDASSWPMRFIGDEIVRPGS